MQEKFYNDSECGTVGMRPHSGRWLDQILNVQECWLSAHSGQLTILSIILELTYNGHFLISAQR